MKPIKTLATAAALMVLVISLWSDWSLVATLKRTILAYIGFSLFGAAFALGVHAVLHLENKSTGPATKVSGAHPGDDSRNSSHGI